MKADAPQIQVVPALPGFFAVYDIVEDKCVAVCEPVVAWRIETFYYARQEKAYSDTYPLSPDGDVGGNCIGVQYSDGRIALAGGSLYRSIAELQAKRYPDNPGADTTAFVVGQPAEPAGSAESREVMP